MARHTATSTQSSAARAMPVAAAVAGIQRRKGGAGRGRGSVPGMRQDDRGEVVQGLGIHSRLDVPRPLLVY